MKSQHSKLIERSRNIMDRPFAEIAIGDTATFTRKVTNQDILDFATLTEDVNPIHIDEDFAAGTMFKGRIAHGILTVGFISALIGTILPGKNVIYLSQNCKFTAPVRIGDTIKIVGEIIDKRPRKNILTLQTNAYNQKDEIVLEGSAVVMKKEQS
ncbi:MaoC family dehydratase [Bacillus sp. FJAT-29790]|uniref:MaoC family dehydratase n=1 Tax=Bacillus sp. FJAT-29790 TaxID=1895002 RepID=UPI001C214EEA|nr:MaoC family dehydratase [Bacillus sp. FJAT-29790]MBU8881223.1 MaoC family dehydratase [Bacillus sp. FJAT-29790]